MSVPAVLSLENPLALAARRERMGRAARQFVNERAAVPVYAAKLGSIIGSVVTNDVRQPA